MAKAQIDLMGVGGGSGYEEYRIDNEVLQGSNPTVVKTINCTEIVAILSRTATASDWACLRIKGDSTVLATMSTSAVNQQIAWYGDTSSYSQITIELFSGNSGSNPKGTFSILALYK